MVTRNELQALADLHRAADALESIARSLSVIAMDRAAQLTAEAEAELAAPDPEQSAYHNPPEAG